MKEAFSCKSATGSRGVMSVTNVSSYACAIVCTNHSLQRLFVKKTFSLIR